MLTCNLLSAECKTADIAASQIIPSDAKSVEDKKYFAEEDACQRALSDGSKITPGTKDVRDILIDIACRYEDSGNTQKARQVLKRTLASTREHWPNDGVAIGRIASILALIDSLHGNTTSASEYRKQVRQAYAGSIGLPETELTTALSRLMFWGFFGPITFEEWTGGSDSLKRLLAKRFGQLNKSTSIDQSEVYELVPIALAINSGKTQQTNQDLIESAVGVLTKIDNNSGKTQTPNQSLFASSVATHKKNDTENKPDFANEFLIGLLLAQKGDLTNAQMKLTSEGGVIQTKSAAKEHIDWNAIHDLPAGWPQAASKQQIDNFLPKAPDIFGPKDVCLLPVFMSIGNIDPDKDEIQRLSYTRALGIASNWIDPNEDSIETARGLLLLAWLQDHAQQYDKAAASIKRALPIYQKIYGPESIQVAYVLSSYGKSNASLKNYAEADEAIRRAIAIVTKVTSQSNPLLTSAITEIPILTDLAAYYESTGQKEKAKNALDQVRKIAQQKSGIVTSAVAFVPYLGTLDKKSNVPEPTMSELEILARDVDKQLDSNPTDSTNRSDWIVAQTKLASAYTKAKEFPKADQLFQRIFQMLNDWHEADSYLSVRPLQEYVELLKLTGKNIEADSFYSKMINIIEKLKR
ncbi:MAG: tetratricopeptide repeat protein [Candidatus Obscuribacterales bacterium]|nr:tetratricopeptide repeat protein [Candidatus Obscuribacterales bacterium]